ncbi:MAG: hypothetical protein IT458_14550 [Planctomycetes bacterium]|nr:hypothetical protein [Planctomycetota bacterium]
MAQGSEVPPRRYYVFHVYVDPMYGDDVEATASNPKTATGTPVGRRPLDLHPEAGNPKPITGILQHAPFAFRTLTGLSGALAYLNSQFGPPPATPSQSWWVHPDHGRVVNRALIHLMPGLYGPVGASLPRIDLRSGLPFNGETWPARIHDRISLQGLSALDTILDARGQATAILEIWDATTGEGQRSHENSFLDSLTIRGARHGEAPGAGAGVWIHSWHETLALPSRMIRITNCILTDNSVGIALDGSRNDQGSVPQRPRIVNNTIAWNGIGIWAGNARYALVTDHNPVVVNNVFDSGSPGGYATNGLSGFEGLAGEDMIVGTAAGSAVGLDMNAWEVTTPPSVLNGASFPNWPLAPLPFGKAGSPAPRVAIQAYTGGAAGPRPGGLYVNDILRLSGIGSLDYSAHDFRLAPNVTTSSTPPGQQVPAPTNPLVNQGLDVTHVPLQMSSQQSLTDPPGYAPGIEDMPTHGWDFDTEGFGNPRSAARAGFAPGTYGTPVLQSVMDLGADEMGDLILAGYLNRTRIYSQTPPTTGVPAHQRVVFFNLIQAGTYPRPQHNTIVGQDFQWWPHVQDLMAVDADQNNYTRMIWPSGYMSEREYLLTAPQPPYEAVPRSLPCDVSPHPMPDPHPYWYFFHTPYLWPPQSFPDQYSQSPWFGWPLPPTPTVTRDNPTLYYNYGVNPHSMPHFGFDPQFGTGTTFVWSSHINPPGSWPQPVQWVISPTAVFGPFGTCTPGTPGTYTVGVWGFGDAGAGCPDVIGNFATYPGQGIRYNCELAPGSGSNLQTFLVIVAFEGPDTGGSSSSRQLQPFASPGSPSRDHLLRLLREGQPKR